MQWLIDLLWDKIELGDPTFIEAVDNANIYNGIWKPLSPTAAHFLFDNMYFDGAWHDLNLESIIPSTAKAVLLQVLAGSTNADDLLYIRPKGITQYGVRIIIISQVAYQLFTSHSIMRIPLVRRLQYMAPELSGWGEGEITIQGYMY